MFNTPRFSSTHMFNTLQQHPHVQHVSAAPTCSTHFSSTHMFNTFQQHPHVQHASAAPTCSTRHASAAPTCSTRHTSAAPTCSTRHASAAPTCSTRFSSTTCSTHASAAPTCSTRFSSTHMFNTLQQHPHVQHTSAAPTCSTHFSSTHITHMFNDLFLLQAFHAVANFKSSDDITLTPPAPPPKEDPLRALTERGHESVYNKGPASASESNDEIAAAPVPLDREKDSMGSLKRASVDVELLAPRSPMGKETMLTFSNTLPRASMNPVQPVQRRLKAVQVPVDPMRSQQLVSEWKQKSMEMRGLSIRDEAEREASEDGSEADSVGTDEGGSQVHVYQHPLQSGRAPSSRNPTPPPGGAKAVATPRPPQIPEAGPPSVSPKSALTRAKWLAIREKTSGEGSARSTSNQPRLMQVIAMSKQQGLLPSSSSETTSTIDPPHYRPHSDPPREGAGIITVDAHAPHHPVVQATDPPQAPPLAGNGNPWEWSGAPNGGDPRDTYDLNSMTRGDSSARGSSFRPHRSASPRAAVDHETASQVEMSAEAQRREMAMRRKTALVLLDREIRNQSEQENYYKSLQGRRYKD
uniref:Phospholipid phosphatase related 3b n=1 Tax=Labrus bergylta TaxID=56723 RepID=A0A3Q3EF14_9LABR